MRGMSAAVMIMAAALTWGAADVSAQRRGGDPKAAAMKNPVPATAASIKAGQQAYAKNCRHCHGLRGAGDGPLAPKNPSPPNLTDATWDFGASDGEIFAIIMNGSPTPKSEMKPMKGTLADRDVWNVVNFLRSIGPKAAKR
jgi:mono/diheme cytochrome c family protein